MMKPWIPLIVLGGCIAGSSGVAALRGSADPAAPVVTSWLPSFEAAQSAAREAGKPIFLVFR